LVAAMLSFDTVASFGDLSSMTFMDPPPMLLPGEVDSTLDLLFHGMTSWSDQMHEDELFPLEAVVMPEAKLDWLEAEAPGCARTQRPSPHRTALVRQEEPTRPSLPFREVALTLDIDPRTPTVCKARPSPETPPAFIQKEEVIADVDEAIALRSRALLCVALSHGHRCCREHFVTEAVARKSIAALELLAPLSAEEIDEHCCRTRPLHVATRSCESAGDVGHQMVEWLLQKGANPNRLCGDAEAPLHIAVKFGLAEVVRMLLAHGADPNACDDAGSTALHTLCKQTPFRYCAEEAEVLLKTLVQYGARPYVLDHAGCAPLHYALQEGLRKSIVAAEGDGLRCQPWG